MAEHPEGFAIESEQALLVVVLNSGTKFEARLSEIPHRQPTAVDWIVLFVC